MTSHETTPAGEEYEITTGRPAVLADIPDVLALVAAGTVDPAPIFSDEIAWEDAAESAAQPLLHLHPEPLRCGAGLLDR